MQQIYCKVLFMNPLISLLKQFKNIDLNLDFLTAFSNIHALMNNHEVLYNETFTLSTPYLDESNYHTAELIHELISKNIPHTHTQDFYSFELPSNVFAFLINKLSSNLKRLYSFNRNKGKKYFNSTKEELLEQQKIIYSCLEKIYPYIQHSEQQYLILNSFLGKDKFVSLIDAFYYLSFHENILPNHLTTHINILNHLKITNVSTLTIKECFKLRFNKNLYSIYSPLIINLDNEKIVLSEFSNIYSDYSLLLFFHIVDLNNEQKIPISDQQKQQLLFSLFSYNKLSKYSFEEVEQFIPQLNVFFKKFQKELTQKTNEINIYNIRNDYGAYALLKITEQPNISLLYLYTFLDDFEIPTHIAEIIKSKYIVSNNNLYSLINDFTYLKNSKDQEKILLNLLNYFNELITPEILSYMFGRLSPHLFPLLTKFSLKLQMEKEIPIENKNSSNVKKNIDKI